MSAHEFLVLAVLLGSIAFFGGAAVIAFAWSAQQGQFSNFPQAARSIFDADEPIGQSTDKFPPAWDACPPAKDEFRPLGSDED